MTCLVIQFMLQKGCINDHYYKRSLLFITKETSPGEMFNQLKSLLKSFPAHQFRTN